MLTNIICWSASAGLYFLELLMAFLLFWEVFSHGALRNILTGEEISETRSTI
jgi:hypothetical protein